MQEWHGMTVKELMNILSQFDENEAVVIRSGIGWNGVSFSDIEVIEGEMPEDGGDFYAGVSSPKMRDVIILQEY